jgi:hypothetical protein
MIFSALTPEYKVAFAAGAVIVLVVVLVIAMAWDDRRGKK